MVEEKLTWSTGMCFHEQSANGQLEHSMSREEPEECSCVYMGLFDITISEINDKISITDFDGSLVVLHTILQQLPCALHVVQESVQVSEENRHLYSKNLELL